MNAEAHSPSVESLVGEHSARVLRVCRSILRREDLARDAAQETFVRLWERMERGTTIDDPAAWLRKVAVSASLDLARRRGVRERAENEHRIAPDAVAPEFASPPARASAAELESALDAALETLPEGQRTVFLLRHRGGLTLAEVAELLDLSLPTVKTHFSRAALKLHASLARFFDEGPKR